MQTIWDTDRRQSIYFIPIKGKSKQNKTKEIIETQCGWHCDGTGTRSLGDCLSVHPRVINIFTYLYHQIAVRGIAAKRMAFRAEQFRCRHQCNLQIWKEEITSTWTGAGLCKWLQTCNGISQQLKRLKTKPRQTSQWWEMTGITRRHSSLHIWAKMMQAAVFTGWVGEARNRKMYVCFVRLILNLSYTCGISPSFKSS